MKSKWQRNHKHETENPGTNQETRELGRRVHAVYAMVFLSFTGLILRLGFVQISQGWQYRAQAQTVSFTKVPVLPARGWIYEANGNLIAYDKPSYSVYFTRFKHVRQDIPAMANRLAPVFQMKPQDVVKLLNADAEYATVRLFKNINQAQLSFFKEHQSEFPGVSVNTDSQRCYPYGDLAGHVLGYVGPIMERDKDRYSELKYKSIQTVGETGIEAQYESRLQGTLGYQLVQVNNAGVTTKQLGYAPAPKSGDYMQLTLDGHLQAKSQQIVMDVINQSKYKKDIHSASAVLLDVKTGGVLAMVSYPYYDPNWYTGNEFLKHAQYLKTSGAQLNYAIQVPNYPGSTVKPANLIAGLERGVVSPYQTFFDRYTTKFGTDTVLKDDADHGIINPTLAITVSCETFFYELGLSLGKWIGVSSTSGGYPEGGMGIQTWRNVGLSSGMNLLFRGQWRFGLGQHTGVDLPGEERGRFWIEDARGRPVSYDFQASEASLRKTGRYVNYGSPADLAFAATGQAQQYTPIQLAQYVATIANNGRKMQPHLLKAFYASNMHSRLTDKDNPISEMKAVVQGNLNINRTYLRVVQRGMYGVCNSPQGTAYGLFRSAPYRAAGKTGTAQIVLDGKQQYNSVFVGYAPFANPQIAVAVMAPGGGYGAETSAQIARDMMDTYFAEHHASFIPPSQWQNTEMPADWTRWPAYEVPEQTH